MNHRFYWILAFIVSGSRSVLFAQIPLLVDQIAEGRSDSWVELSWRIDAGERALESGLIHLAEHIFRSVLENGSELSDGEVPELKMALARCLIAQKRYASAQSQLEDLSVEWQSSRQALYRAICVYGQDLGGTEVFRSALAKVDPKDLSSDDLPWYSLLEGLEAEMDERPSRAIKAFEQAMRQAQSPMLRAHFESLVFQQKLRLGTVDEDLVRQLEANLNQYQGEDTAYSFTREYAVALHQLERNDEAIAILNRELADPKGRYRTAEREQLRLLKAMIQGVESEAGRLTLKELIRNGQNSPAMGVALHLLARSSDSNEDLLSFLNRMIDRPDPHILIGQMLYMRIQLMLSGSGKMSEAVEDAKLLLEHFPGFSEIEGVYRLLAYASLKHDPPRYRAAADFLLQLRDRSESDEKSVELNRLIGDCYFLNKDYANAVGFYKVAWGIDHRPTDLGPLFLRLISAQVRAGEIEDALQSINEAEFRRVIRPMDRWRAEWNVAQTLKAQGDFKQALQRVRTLLKESGSGVPPALDIRLCWLEAYLSLELKELEGLNERIGRLLSRLESLPQGTVAPEEALLLKTEILLLHSRVLIDTGDSEAGIRGLSGLREEFGTTAAAQRAYLIEAAYHGRLGDYSSAESQLRKLAEEYPKSPLAPRALFEVALYLEGRGAEFYSQALISYNNLLERYPSDPLYYVARLKQGNLLRRMNDFAGAQIIYESLINRFPAHEMRYISELSRVDCRLALSGSESENQEDIIADLKRLLDLPNLPPDFQAEAAYKWAFVLLRNDFAEEAKEVFSLSTARFLLDGRQAMKLGASGRYWVARSILELGKILEEEGSPAEARRLYRKIVAYNLPGRNIANARVGRLTNTE